MIPIESIRRPSFVPTYAATFVAEALAAVGYLFAFRVIAQRLGTQGFGEYALSRRILSFLAPIALLGLDLAVVRYVSYSSARRDSSASIYLSTALAVMGVCTIILSVPLLTMSPLLAQLFFGNSQYAPLVRIMPVLVAGSALHAVTYGYFRGRLWMARANTLSVVNQGVVPLIAAIAGSSSIPTVLGLTGGLWLATSTVALTTTPIDINGMRSHVWELVRFGARRLPGYVLLMTYFGLPGVLLAHLSTVREAGAVLFGVTILGLAGTSLTPISLVLLPFASQYMATGNRHALISHVLKIAGLGIGLVLIATIMFEALTPVIIRAYLGSNFSYSVTLLRIVMTGALPWGIHVIFRSIIDAHHTKAINGRLTAIAFVSMLVITVVSMALISPAFAIALGLVGGLWVLGILTLIETFRILRIDSPWVS